jgi:hypothetical protein
MDNTALRSGCAGAPADTTRDGATGSTCWSLMRHSAAGKQLVLVVEFLRA